MGFARIGALAHAGQHVAAVRQFLTDAAELDELIADSCRKLRDPLARTAIVVVYVWFGALKFFDASPANPLVRSLLNRTLPFVGFEQFIVFLAIYEIAIGVLFAIPHFERYALLLIIPHLAMTTGPLFFLPEIAWRSFLVPTLEGQYIIKNVLIVAAAAGVAAQVHARRAASERARG
ncbi:MAG TPA: hypothetical protein VI356_00740 [Myxococcales bacterium]